MLAQVIFALLFLAAGFFFTKRILFIRRNILLGRDIDLRDRKKERWITMLRVAIGQNKMVARPVAGILHILVYLGFVIINLEMLEIIVDGLFGTHRIFSGIPFYSVLIASFEFLAFSVLTSCVIFLVRRHVIAIARFKSPEMGGWPSLDANIILIAEILLMSAFLIMNAADSVAMSKDFHHYADVSIDPLAFPISGLIASSLEGLSESTIVLIERSCWWFHIVGVLCFLVYVPYSKHFHIFLAFPNTYYSNLDEKSMLYNMVSVKKEVDLIMDPNADSFVAPASDASVEPPRFGVKDATDLSWKQLMEAYSCTECGRCTSECPANITGKMLSPRKIMMDSRDRIDEIGHNMDANGGEFKPDGKSLVGSYITEEELWACTSCQACVQACPINISPMGIIIDMRRSLIMEESKSPESITSMFNNIENNGAPWAFAASSRGDWIQEES